MTAVTPRKAPAPPDSAWLLGCALSLVVTVTGATFGTFMDIRLVFQAQLYCLVDLSAGEAFAEMAWAASRVLVMPVVSLLSGAVSPVVALPARLPWVAGRAWVAIPLALLQAGVAATGPVALILHDIAVEGTPEGCVLPWWPAWLPS